MSSGAAMVISHPAINPYDLRHSNGCVGAKRMVWFIAHQANAVSKIRRLGIKFQVLVPGQLMAQLGTVWPSQQLVQRLTVSPLTSIYFADMDCICSPLQVCRQVAELLAESRYEQGVAYGFRHNMDIIPFD
jgi:hypothetical protein